MNYKILFFVNVLFFNIYSSEIAKPSNSGVKVVWEVGDCGDKEINAKAYYEELKKEDLNAPFIQLYYAQQRGIQQGDSIAPYQVARVIIEKELQSPSMVQEIVGLFAYCFKAKAKSE